MGLLFPLSKPHALPCRAYEQTGPRTEGIGVYFSCDLVLAARTACSDGWRTLLAVPRETSPNTKPGDIFSDEHLAVDVLENMYVGIGWFTAEGILLNINEVPRTLRIE